MLCTGSMTSGESPTILLPSELLWFEQQSDCSSAIEGVFGVSQGMLLAAAEVRALSKCSQFSSTAH